jgi:hypothetical protein
MASDGAGKKRGSPGIISSGSGVMEVLDAPAQPGAAVVQATISEATTLHRFDCLQGTETILEYMCEICYFSKEPRKTASGQCPWKPEPVSRIRDYRNPQYKTNEGWDLPGKMSLYGILMLHVTFKTTRLSRAARFTNWT